MLPKTFTLALLAATATANGLKGVTPATPLNALLKRQTTSSCDTGDKECGVGCIPMTYTCCPDEQGGCPVSQTCEKGDNDMYGCCPIGETCTGDGGTDETGGGSGSSSGSDDDSSSSSSGDDEGSAARNALSFVGAVAAAALAL